MSLLYSEDFGEYNLITQRHYNSNNRDCVPNYIGDGWCDNINNNEECEYDGGDCCPGDCQSVLYDCSEYGGDCDDCIDPSSFDLTEEGECYVENEEHENCLDGETQYIITCGGGIYQSEVYWELFSE